MKILTILRLPKNAFATFGVMMGENNVPFCVTLERLWKNNERGISCIAPGDWIMKPSFFHPGDPNGYVTWEIICPPREEVKVHIGNIDDDSHGCVLTGEYFDPVLNRKTGLMEPGILSSGPAFKQFMDYLKGEHEARLVIKEV